MVHYHFSFSIHYDRSVHSFSVVAYLAVAILQIRESRIPNELCELVESVNGDRASEHSYFLDKLYPLVREGAIAFQNKRVDRTSSVAPTALNPDLGDPVIGHIQRARCEVGEAD